MAFPNKSVLDNFNRAGPALGANWTTISGDTASVIASSTVLAASSRAATDGVYWNVAQYGPDCEAYITVPTINVASLGVWLFVRSNAAQTTYCYISYNATSTSAGTFAIGDAGASHTYTGVAFVAGDKFGIQAIGNQL